MYKVYNRGDAILIKINIKKWITQLQYDNTDPDTIKITIKYGAETKVDDITMVKDGENVGYYYYVWQSLVGDDVGEYDVTITTTINSYKEITKEVIELK